MSVYCFSFIFSKRLSFLYVVHNFLERSFSLLHSVNNSGETPFFIGSFVVLRFNQERVFLREFYLIFKPVLDLKIKYPFIVIFWRNISKYFQFFNYEAFVNKVEKSTFIPFFVIK